MLICNLSRSDFSNDIKCHVIACHGIKALIFVTSLDIWGNNQIIESIESIESIEMIASNSVRDCQSLPETVITDQWSESEPNNNKVFEWCVTLSVDQMLMTFVFELWVYEFYDESVVHQLSHDSDWSPPLTTIRSLTDRCVPSLDSNRQVWSIGAGHLVLCLIRINAILSVEVIVCADVVLVVRDWHHWHHCYCPLFNRVSETSDTSGHQTRD